MILGDSEDRLDRMALLLGIYEGSSLLLGDAERWLKAPNTGSPFDGKTPLTYILEDQRNHLRNVYHYLRGAVGGRA